jgi:uncharacterized protein (DUF1015 family)
VIRPFQALRPAPERAAAVSSVPYDVVNADEARQLAAGNPLSFLHVTRSEIDLPLETDPYADVVYATAKANLAALRAKAPLIVEAEPALYVYRLRMGTHEQMGVAGCFSLDEYEHDLIKKHERTRRDKEDDRTRHIVEVRAQTGVVFLTYRSSAGVDRLMPAIVAQPPVYDFDAPDGVRHTVWKTSGDQTTALMAAFASVPALYIADGHHRAASALRARSALGKEAGGEPSTFIAVAFPDNQAQILPYNRTVKDLAGQTPEQFLDRLAARVPVREGQPTPRGKGEVSMFLSGRWYALDVSALVPADGLKASSLDVALLQQHILEPLLKIGDIRSDKRIDFVGGRRGTEALERAVTSGHAAVAFCMHPVTIDDLMSIADQGGIMPPKSTWFEPKLRDGLIVHVI